MEIVLIVAAAVLIACLALFVVRTRERRREARLERERAGRRVEGHREEARLHASRVESLEPQAQEHRQQAREHTAMAEELEERVERSRELESAHEERAVRAEKDLDGR